jgi:hypothetical protein
MCEHDVRFLRAFLQSTAAVPQNAGWSGIEYGNYVWRWDERRMQRYLETN